MMFVVNVAEHERMAEAYDLMNQKLHQSLVEQAKSEKVIQQLKVHHLFTWL